MIYVEILNEDIGLIHYKPFDTKDGLHKTKEELEKNGVLVESLPIPEYIEGKTVKLKYNSKNNTLYYEYMDIGEIHKTEIEILQERIKALEQSNAELTTLIATMSTPQQ